MTHPRCHYFWRDPSLVSRFQTAVSLHSHTQHSKELLDFIPRYARRVPVMSQLVKAQEEKYERLHGRALDFAKAWWTPPLSAREAYELEQRQIEHTLGLKALVSLSDHDDIEAPMHLHVLSEMRDVPISVEWTVPFGRTFFHIGVHNLPSRHAHSTIETLADYTAHPTDTRLRDALATLTAFPATLLILNHPLWDETAVGNDIHVAELRRFVGLFGSSVHAAELNGLRDARENARVMQFAGEVGLPVISGGDRHGCEPNANVNLTNASTFEEFVHEVRYARQSTVLFLNQYREPIRLRLMQGVVDAVRDYPEFPKGRRKWTDRVFFQSDDGSVKSLSSVWLNGGPQVVRWFIGGTRLLQSRRIRLALRMALAERQEGVT